MPPLRRVRGLHRPQTRITPLLVASGIASSSAAPNYLVLGTVAARVWRSGIARGVSLEAVRESMADFNEYLRVNVAPAAGVVMGTILRATPIRGDEVYERLRRKSEDRCAARK